MENYSIGELYTLPSKGKVYKVPVNPEIKLRSMTTEEEMKRLSPSDRAHQKICEIIDDCMITDPGISSYDMCLGDQQFLLHKLRIVTYGPDYALLPECPYCGCATEERLNLEDLAVKEFDDELLKCFEFELPKTKKRIKLRLQTPRTVDDVTLRVKELKKKSPDFKGDAAILFTLEGLIETIDGMVPDPLELERFVRTLPMMDTNYIVKHAQKINEGIGLDTKLNITCDVCGLDYTSSFRTTAEFFGPAIDI